MGRLFVIMRESILTEQQHNEMMLERVERARHETMRLQPRRVSLRDFIKQAWPVLEPDTQYKHGWHIDAISDHLEAVTSGEIRNLLINIPPRHMKSLAVSVFWPAWVWTTQAEKRWLFASYAEKLSIRDNLKCRRLIRSDWYQRNWGSVFQLAGDQNQKSRFENDRTGYRIATGIGGGITGEGADVIVCDDPHKVIEAESETVRENVLVWWDETMSTRLNDPKTGSKVIVMQRVHESDLSGHVLEKGDYEHLCLPAEYESTQRVTGIGFKDPRRKEGSPLWPAQYPEEALTRLQNALGVYGTAGQLQQRPTPRGGGMFKKELWGFAGVAPLNATRVRYWDKAGTAGGGAYTVGVLMARDTEGRFFVEDVVRGQWEAGPRENMMLLTARLDVSAYGNTVQIWHEQEGGSGGKESAQATNRKLAGFLVYAERVTGSKEVRASPLSAQQGAENVYIVEGNWDWKGYINRMSMFPMGKYKDETDASSGAFNKLAPVHRLARGLTEKVAKTTPSRFVEKRPKGGRFNRRR